MGQPKGSKKLRRCAKDAAYYKAQFNRTERNKARRAARVARRKAKWIEPKTTTVVEALETQP